MVGEQFMLLTDFSKAFDAVFHNIITRQADNGLGKWIVRWTENWQNIQVQRGAISSTKPTGGESLVV